MKALLLTFLIWLSAHSQTIKEECPNDVIHPAWEHPCPPQCLSPAVDELTQSRDTYHTEALTPHILLWLAEVSLLGGFAYACKKEKEKYSLQISPSSPYFTCQRRRSKKQLSHAGEMRPIDNYLEGGCTLAKPAPLQKKEIEVPCNAGALIIRDNEDEISLIEFFRQRAHALHNICSMGEACLGGGLPAYPADITFDQQRHEKEIALVNKHVPVFREGNERFCALLAKRKKNEVIRRANSSGVRCKLCIIALQGFSWFNMVGNSPYKKPLALVMQIAMSFHYYMLAGEWNDSWVRQLNWIKQQHKKWKYPFFSLFIGFEVGSSMLCLSSTLEDSSSWWRFVTLGTPALSKARLLTIIYWIYIYQIDKFRIYPTRMGGGLIVSILGLLASLPVLYKDYLYRMSGSQIKRFADELSYDIDRIAYHIKERRKVVEAVRQAPDNGCVLPEDMTQLLTDYLYSRQEQELFIKEWQRAKRVQRRKALIWGVGSLGALVAFVHSCILVAKICSWYEQ